MRSFWLSSLLLLPACMAPRAHLVATNGDRIVEVIAAADQLAGADVVVLGELHQTPPVHELHHELLAALHERRPNMVLAMEMFERDQQVVLLKYLTGFIDEATFRAETREPSHYERDYRPVIEFAKANRLVVLAANTPRPLASQVAREGVAAVAGNVNVARETTAPEDDYWESFVEKMKAHPGAAPTQLKNYYAAQCLKDDTMAESITDYLKERRRDGERPLCVLICGREHSDHGRGTVMRIRNRMPDLDVRVLSAETVKDISSGVYSSPKGVGDFVVVSPEVPREPMPLMPIEPAVAKAEPPKAEPVAPAPTPPRTNPPGLSPALGFRPEYEAGNEGVTVGELRPGGAAEKAGMETGDVIVMLAGIKVVDVQNYTEVLNELIIGSKVPVRIRRANAEVELQVEVGSRTSTR